MTGSFLNFINAGDPYPRNRGLSSVKSGLDRFEAFRKVGGFGSSNRVRNAAQLVNRPDGSSRKPESQCQPQLGDRVFFVPDVGDPTGSGLDVGVADLIAGSWRFAGKFAFSGHLVSLLFRVGDGFAGEFGNAGFIFFGTSTADANSDPRRAIRFRVDDHDIGEVDGCLFGENSALSAFLVRSPVFIDQIDSFHYRAIPLPKDFSDPASFAFVFAGDHFDQVADPELGFENAF